MQPAEPVQPAVQNTPDLFEGGSINPDELPDELQPLAKQLQAAFTQKTQQLAEQRRQYEPILEAGVDPQELLGLYSRVADPQQWPQLAAELAEAAQHYGVELPFGAVMPPAGQQPVEPVEPKLDEIPDDPELAPLKEALRVQQQELSALKQAREEEARIQEGRQMQQALLGELSRQEAVIHQNHPDWANQDSPDMDDVYAMSSFWGGDLLKATAALEARDKRAIERYIAAKEAHASARSVQPAPKDGGSSSAQPTEPRTIREAEAEAVEYLRARMGDEDFQL